MKKALMLFWVIILLLISGCINEEPVISSKPETKENDIVPEHPIKEVEEPVKDKVQLAVMNMTLEEKIGQMFIMGFQGTEVSQDIKTLMLDYKPGGIILFDRNIKDAKQLQNLVGEIKEINNANKFPLLISIDEEGGRVSRLPNGSKKFPSSKKIGSKNDKALAYNNGQEIANELHKFGINMNFAPVLDINSNSKNTVIGDRAFGKNPEIVAQLGIETMKGLQSKNIISVIKHFPGHGDTDADSHTELPVVHHDRTRLDTFELIPFKEAIKSGADVVMTSHILFPKIDNSGKPATMSKIILTDMLRSELGFNGVIVTDDMEMGAIAKNFTLKEAVLGAVSAGADILLICHSFENQKSAFNELKDAVENGSISIERINESVERIVRLKQKYLDGI